MLVALLLGATLQAGPEAVGAHHWGVQWSKRLQDAFEADPDVSA